MIGSFLASVATQIIHYRRLVATLFIEMFFISCLQSYYNKLTTWTCHFNCIFLRYKNSELFGYLTVFTPFVLGFFEVCSSSLL